MFTTACWVFSGPESSPRLKIISDTAVRRFLHFFEDLLSWQGLIEHVLTDSTLPPLLQSFFLSLGRCRDSASALDSLGAEEGVPINQPGLVSCVLTSLCCYFYKYFEAAAIFKPRRRSGIVNGKTNVERDRFFLWVHESAEPRATWSGSRLMAISSWCWFLCDVTRIRQKTILRKFWRWAGERKLVFL